MPSKHYHHGDLRNELIESTRTLVEMEGSDGVTLARIAAACGVSVAAPYRHFASKEELLGEVAGRGFAELGEALAAAGRSPGEPRERLLNAGVAYVDYAVAHPNVFRLMFNAAVREPQSQIGPAALAQLVSLVEPVVSGVPTETAVRATWALAHGLATLRIGGMLTFTREDSERRLRQELDALLTGIAG